MSSLNTKIQWTDTTWSPVRGCSRVSPGCDNCYAMRQAHRFSAPGQPYSGLTTLRRGKVDWAGHARLHPDMLDQPLRWRKPRRVFVNSMSDLFHSSLSNDEIAAVFGVMAACPQHTFQVLTKRPERMREWFEWAARQTAYGGAECFIPEAMQYMAMDYSKVDGDTLVRGGLAETWPLPNVWLGVSVENQKTADERIPLLLETPAAIRFISAEPLLAPLDLTAHLFVPTRCNECGATEASYDPNPNDLPVIHTCLLGMPVTGEPGAIRCNSCKSLDVNEQRPLDWVIVGGESGNGARMCCTNWIKSIVEQCEIASTPVFVKQLGSRHVSAFAPDGEPIFTRFQDKAGGDPSEWPALDIRQFPEVTP